MSFPGPFSSEWTAYDRTEASHILLLKRERDDDGSVAHSRFDILYDHV